MPAVFAALRSTLGELLPAAADVPISHSWGGPLGISRDWHPSVGLDRATGLGWAGGYVGDGVAASNLAGRTLADLALGRDTDLTGLPWVGSSVPGLGGGAVTVAGCQCRVAGDALGRPGRGPSRAAVPAGRRGEPGAGPMREHRRREEREVMSSSQRETR